MVTWKPPSQAFPTPTQSQVSQIWVYSRDGGGIRGRGLLGTLGSIVKTICSKFGFQETCAGSRVPQFPICSFSIFVYTRLEDHEVFVVKPPTLPESCCRPRLQTPLEALRRPQ